VLGLEDYDGRRMHRTPDWIFEGLALVWLLTPWLLVAVAWRRWWAGRNKQNVLEEFIDDPAFLVGQILATISCAAFVAPLIQTGHWRLRELEYAPALGTLAALIALPVLPFALKRAKWFPFAGCLLNVGLALEFFLLNMR
jgi:hypothetical protein